MDTRSNSKLSSSHRVRRWLVAETLPLPLIGGPGLSGAWARIALYRLDHTLQPAPSGLEHLVEFRMPVSAALLGALCLSMLRRPSPFLYFQF